MQQVLHSLSMALESITFNYDRQLDPWYSAAEVIKRFVQLESMFGEDLLEKNDFKKAREIFYGAATLLGTYISNPKNNYYIQINRQTSSPDVVATKQIEKGIWTIAQLEITEFEEHFATNDMFEFLRKTKLSKKKSYSEFTIIVCIVNRSASIDEVELSKKLKELKPKSAIYILGKPRGSKWGEFMVFSPYPSLTKSINYDVYETASKIKLIPRTLFKVTLDKKHHKEVARPEPFNIFEMFGLNEKLLKLKYKLK